MAEHKARARSIKLPALQHETLRVMGIDVPWVVSAEMPTREAVDDRVADRPGSQDDLTSSPAAAPHVAVPLSPAPVQKPDLPATVVVPTQEASVAETAAVASMSLDQLVTCVRDCQQCGLAASRKNAVPGQGVLKPSVMVVGEAPGEQEDLQGFPFVGPSGQLLDNMLASIGLSREQNVYIANTIKCRPPGNRNPRDTEIQSCMPYLQRQIELLEPQVILAVGLFASQTLLQSTAGVQAMRSQQHQIVVGGRNIPVIVTYHPAYLLRRPADKRLAWQDLKRIWSLLQT